MTIIKWHINTEEHCCFACKKVGFIYVAQIPMCTTYSMTPSILWVEINKKKTCFLSFYPIANSNISVPKWPKFFLIIWQHGMDLMFVLHLYVHSYMFRKDRWAGLLYVSDNDAQADATGRPQNGNPGGLEDDRQTEERIHPGIWAPGQAHHVRRETHEQRR